MAVANLNPRVIHTKKVGWIYIVNHYALLHAKYESYWPHGFRRYLKFFPIIRKLMTDPQGMTKLDPRGTVGMSYGGDHKTLLYIKYINYGPHGKDFISMRAIDHLWELPVCIKGA